MILARARGAVLLGSGVAVVARPQSRQSGRASDDMAKSSDRRFDLNWKTVTTVLILGDYRKSLEILAKRCEGLQRHCDRLKNAKSIGKTPKYLVRLEPNGVQKVAGSNPVTPTYRTEDTACVSSDCDFAGRYRAFQPFAVLDVIET